jgi:hypothetical protein
MPLLARVIGARRTEVLKQDSAVRQAASEGPEDPEKFARLLETFLASPMTGMTTMLDYARIHSGFRPFISTEMKQFYEYLKHLPYPLFGPIQEPGMQFDVTVGDGAGGKNVEQIVASYAGSDAEIASLIRGQIQDTMGAAVRNPGQGQSQTLLFEHSIEAGETFVYRAIKSEIKFVYVMMPPMNYLMKSMGHKSVLALSFNPKEWPSHAEEVVRRHLRTVDDWIRDMEKSG